jgi:peptidoglycan hydrolase-like protein with peptidoglycan-binding domain
MTSDRDFLKKLASFDGNKYLLQAFADDEYVNEYEADDILISQKVNINLFNNIKDFAKDSNGKYNKNKLIQAARQVSVTSAPLVPATPAAPAAPAPAPAPAAAPKPGGKSVKKDGTILALQTNLNRLNDNLNGTLFPRGIKPFWTLKGPGQLLTAVRADGFKGSQTNAAIVAFKNKYKQYANIADFSKLNEAVADEANKADPSSVAHWSLPGSQKEERPEVPDLFLKDIGQEKTEPKDIEQQPAPEKKTPFEQIPSTGKEGCPTCKGKGFFKSLVPNTPGIFRCDKCKAKPPAGYLWMQQPGGYTYLIPESNAAKYKLSGYNALPDK